MAAIALYEWLQGERNYRVGLELYRKHGTNEFLKQVLATGETSYNQEKLATEIEALASRSGSAAPRPKPVVPGQTVSSAKKYPVEVQDLVETRVQLFKESSHLHSKVKSLPTQEERRVMATQILDNFDTIDSLWDKVAYYDQHQVLPADAQPAPAQSYETDPIKMAKRLTTVRTYISRDQDNLKKADKVAAWKQELDWLQKELAK